MFHNNLYEMKGIKYSIFLPGQPEVVQKAILFMFPLNCETFLLYFQLLMIYN